MNVNIEAVRASLLPVLTDASGDPMPLILKDGVLCLASMDLFSALVSAGSDGKTILNGEDNPLSSDGTDGDFWINTETNTLFGPKASGAWPAGVSLIPDLTPYTPQGLRNQQNFISKDNSNVPYVANQVAFGIFVTSDDELTAALLNGVVAQGDILNKFKRYSHGGDPANPTSVSHHKTNDIPGLPAQTNSWVVDPVTNDVDSTENTGSVVGFFSKDKFDKYTLTTTLTANDADNDDIGVVIAFFEDNDNRVLNNAFGENPADFNWPIDVFSPSVPNQHSLTVFISRNSTVQSYWVVKDYMKLTEVIVANGSSQLGLYSPTSGWNNHTVDIKVVRDGDLITITRSNFSDVPGGKGPLAFPLAIDLGSNPLLYDFKGKQSYGFAARSQAFASFSNPVFSESANVIYDVRSGDVYTYNAGYYAVDPDRNFFDEIGDNRILFNPYTRKELYIQPDGTIYALAMPPDLTDYALDANVVKISASYTNPSWLVSIPSTKVVFPGSTLQYIRGNGTPATFPTNVGTFTNDAGYLTSADLTPYGPDSAALHKSGSEIVPGVKTFTGGIVLDTMAAMGIQPGSEIVHQGLGNRRWHEIMDNGLSAMLRWIYWDDTNNPVGGLTFSGGNAGMIYDYGGVSFMKSTDVDTIVRNLQTQLKGNYAGGYLTTLFSGSVSGWDQVLGEQGNIIKVSDGFWAMVYTGFVAPNTGTNTYLGIATSTDGKTFTREGTTGNGLIIPTISLEDPNWLYNPANSTYYIYAEDKSAVPFRNIRCFTSTNRTSWTDHGAILDIGAPASWEEKDVSSPCVKLIGGVFYLFYEGRALGQHGAIGLATSTDGFTFTKNVNNPIIRGTELASPTFSWAAAVVPDDIIKVGDLYYMTIHGTVNSNAGFSAGIAVSADLVNWYDQLGGDILKSDNNEYTGNGMMFHYINNEIVPVYQSADNTKLYSAHLQVKADYNIGGKNIATTGGVAATNIAATSGVTAATVITTGLATLQDVVINGTPLTWALDAQNYMLVRDPTTKQVKQADVQTIAILNSNSNGNALQSNAKFHIAQGTISGGSGDLVLSGNSQTWSGAVNNNYDAITPLGAHRFRWTKTTLADKTAMIIGANADTNVQIAAGSTTITPFQILPASFNTTPKTGAIENNGADLAYTDNSGTPVRRIITMADTISVATDANYTVTSANQMIKLPVVTAARTVTLPAAASYTGRTMRIWNQNTSGTFLWTFASTVKDRDSTTVTAIANQTWVILESDGTNWNWIR